ncbi:ankyrin repeat domain-containing protein [Microbacterium gorillae]|uniref:ankyrin repeat domain-containing protein n=1 Tax=Microbacterium gorillae TaxID=1231063 RepID=UPI00058E4772|nr:ankyrin repeat domain-containing protein [Microbacterium gorillae]
MSDTTQPGAGLSDEVIDGTFDLVREGRVGPLGEMIDAGVPVDVRNRRGDTMLIIAAYLKQPHALAELIRRGANLDLENAAGQTAITSAVFRGDEDALRLLLEAGANPDAGFRTGRQIAEQFDQPRMIAVLDEYSARS